MLCVRERQRDIINHDYSIFIYLLQVQQHHYHRDYISVIIHELLLLLVHTIKDYSCLEQRKDSERDTLLKYYKILFLPSFVSSHHFNISS